MFIAKVVIMVIAKEIQGKWSDWKIFQIEIWKSDRKKIVSFGTDSTKCMKENWTYDKRKHLAQWNVHWAV